MKKRILVIGISVVLLFLTGCKKDYTGKYYQFGTGKTSKLNYPIFVVSILTQKGDQLTGDGFPPNDLSTPNSHFSITLNNDGTGEGTATLKPGPWACPGTLNLKTFPSELGGFNIIATGDIPPCGHVELAFLAKKGK